MGRTLATSIEGSMVARGTGVGVVAGVEAGSKEKLLESWATFDPGCERIAGRGRLGGGCCGSDGRRAGIRLTLLVSRLRSCPQLSPGAAYVMPPLAPAKESFQNPSDQRKPTARFLQRRNGIRYYLLHVLGRKRWTRDYGMSNAKGMLCSL